MTEERKKEGEFAPGCVIDIYDEMLAHGAALRALGELLRSADLAGFSEGAYGEGHKDQAADLRWGLSQIIDMYLARQEGILSKYVDQYHKSDICLLKSAGGLISAVEEGAFKSEEVAANRLREVIADLDTVIGRQGDLAEKAITLKARCKEMIQRLYEKEVSRQTSKS